MLKFNILTSILFRILILPIFLMVTSFSAIAAGPTSAEYGTVLNLSGKQRMLTQKMSKEVMLVALNVDTQNNLSNLKKTSGLFAKTLIRFAKR